jgi:predicted regulator of Ras-like GTPase activity (Roadblock/LC7/MglB family)
VAGCNWVLFEEDVERINSTLDVFLRETEAKCVLVIDKGGHLITVRGVTDSMNTASLSALAAGAFASTREIARLIGEPEFSVLFHQGRREHIHVSLIDNDTLLMAIFDDHTTIGIIRLYAKDTEEEIARLFADVRGQRQRGARVLEQLNGTPTDTPFRSA